MINRRVAMFLPAVVAAPALAGLAGNAAAQSAATPTASPVAADTVRVLHAGSLTELVQEGLAPAARADAGLVVTNTAGNSGKVALSIKDGTLVGDVFMSAGADINQTLLGAENGAWVDWFLVFASNEVVIAYSPESDFADQFDQARDGTIPWYDVLAEPGLNFGRDDPNLDPLGYYGVLVGQLAEQFYEAPGLNDRLFGDPTNPAQVISPDFDQLQSGALDAIFAYRTGAETAGVPSITLPDAINLSNPEFDDQYALASYTTDTGQVIQGATIRYTVAPLRGGNEAAALAFIEFLISREGQAITEAAYFLPHPIWAGGDPAAVPPALQGQVAGEYRAP